MAFDQCDFRFDLFFVFVLVFVSENHTAFDRCLTARSSRVSGVMWCCLSAPVLQVMVGGCRRGLSRWNLAKKTLVDKRFLIWPRPAELWTLTFELLQSTTSWRLHWAIFTHFHAVIVSMPTVAAPAVGLMAQAYPTFPNLIQTDNSRNSCIFARGTLHKTAKVLLIFRHGRIPALLILSSHLPASCAVSLRAL